MFVSANAVRAFFAARPAAASFSARAWATGPGTRNALLAAGVVAGQVDAPPPESPQFDSEALWSIVHGQCRAGDRVLIVRGGDAGSDTATGRDWLADRLAAQGIAVDTVLSYVRACPQWTREQRDAASGDGIVWLFSSSQAIEHLMHCMPSHDWSRAKAVATHPRIGAAARDASFGVVCVSRPSIEAVSSVLESLG
jgi:uroporphyrinogen-III synthase